MDGESGELVWIPHLAVELEKTYLPLFIANNLDGSVLPCLVVVCTDHLPE